MSDLKPLIAISAGGLALDEAQAEQAFDILMSGDATPAQIGGFLMSLRVRGETVGALNLFRDAAGRLDEQDMPLAQGMADVAAIALLQERAVRESRDVVQQLQGALTSRVVIEQAKGMLAERTHISVDVAFARLRTHARDHNSRLSDVARDLIDGGLDATLLAQRAPGASYSRR